MENNCKALSFFMVSLMLFAVAGVPMSADAASSSSSSTLRVDVLEYEPYPAEIGAYVSIWVKVENFASGEAEDVSIMLEPEYPLSLDSPSNALQNFGELPPDRSAIHEYRLYVDENAKSGTADFDVLYRASEDFGWQKESFEIRVGSTTFDSRGTVELENLIAEPSVFIPGDEGSISFTLTNTAQASTITIDDEVYDTYARVQSATLTGTDMITITSVPYEGKGVLGPGDSVQVSYNIEVSDAIEDGTYFLDLAMIGNSHSFNNNWMIPLVVDSSSVRVIPSKSLILQNGEGTLEFDVANIHPNALSSVSVMLEAEGVDFFPKEYFVGSMDPDELFTIEIDGKAEDLSTTDPVNVTVIVDYRNGLNQHEEVLEIQTLTFEHVQEESNNAALAVILVIAIVGAVGFYLYRKKGFKGIMGR
ncbi:hypothetical protein J2755_001805 [Methanohalophilus levihalophilus]|uniref:COG1361 S-layer family protein n=1 Tax=Methanohalophilus levihalophilus TaxID=1431282 RepID=UPI001AE53C20|nr:COG1361 S-layer family protein [Methanohalophilus levihalophilus]MBP2030857.1 hypothetical protein [Methanohalophilus levihalophilus]